MTLRTVSRHEATSLLPLLFLFRALSCHAGMLVLLCEAAQDARSLRGAIVSSFCLATTSAVMVMVIDIVMVWVEQDRTEASVALAVFLKDGGERQVQQVCDFIVPHSVLDLLAISSASTRVPLGLQQMQQVAAVVMLRRPLPHKERIRSWSLSCDAWAGSTVSTPPRTV